MAPQATVPPKTLHRETYEAISPLRPELSQAGKTVLITGGGTGVGYAIAEGFLQAAAARIVLVGRRSAVLDSAVSTLTELGRRLGSSTRVLGRACDVADLESTDQLWSALERDGIAVNVLVLSAATITEAETLLGRGRDKLWGDYLINTRALLAFTECFHQQKAAGAGAKKFVINVSTRSIHHWDVPGDRPAYGLTKNAGTLLLQQVAKDVRPGEMQVVSFHPGSVLTPGARNAGFDENSGVPWDNANLGGHFAVWAASDEAEFLHGRFVWAAWDVEELRSPEVAARIKSEPNFLKIGVVGL